MAISHTTQAKENDEVLFAFGAHLDASIALERAVVELNQLLQNTKKEGGKYLIKDKTFTDWLKNIKVKDFPYLSENHQKQKNIIKDYSPLCKESIWESIQFSLKALRDAGLEVLVLNLTKPDIGLPVVRVFIPGLRHFWRRTGPGRLYDVPVKMGWLDRPLQENELNPYSIFI